MKLRPLSTSIASLYLAPDTEGAPAGGSSAAVPASASPTGMDIPTAPKVGGNNPPPVVVQPTPEPQIKQRGIIDVKKALGLTEKPSKSLDTTAKELRERNEKGRFIPVPPIKTKRLSPPPIDGEEPKAPTPTPKAGTEPAPDPTPTPAAPAPVAKFKIGDKEMTAEEMAAELAVAHSKLAKPDDKAQDAPAAPAPTTKKNLTPQEQAAEDKRLDDEFVEKMVTNMPTALDQVTFDKIIADGDVAAFNRLRVRDQLEVRKWMEKTLNPIIEDLYKFRDTASGAVEMHSTIQKYQAEANFLAANPDLKEHLAIARNVRDAFERKYPEQWAKMTNEERDQETANAVRSLPGFKTAAPAAPTTTPVPKAAAPKPKPPTGNVSGGGNAPGKAVDMSSPAYLIQRGKV